MDVLWRDITRQVHNGGNISARHLPAVPCCFTLAKWAWLLRSDKTQKEKFIFLRGQSICWYISTQSEVGTPKWKAMLVKWRAMCLCYKTNLWGLVLYSLRRHIRGQIFTRERRDCHTHPFVSNSLTHQLPIVLSQRGHSVWTYVHKSRKARVLN